jgi:hypothetical protein
MRYQYRFVQASNAAWFAGQLREEVAQVGGSVDVRETAVFVTLPRAVTPGSVGMMYLFVYDEVQDEKGRVVERVDPETLRVA